MWLNNGDLEVGLSSDYQMVEGGAKVAQDLAGALLEPVGVDRFHPGWGSSLHDYTGLVADETSRFSAEQEIKRVISDYAAIQRDKIQQDILSGTASRFVNSEVIVGIGGINVNLNRDTISVNIGIRTASGSGVVVAEAV